MFPRRGDCWAAIAVLLLTVANAGNSINVSASGTLDNSDTEALPRGMQSHLRSELIINANSVDDLYSGLNLAVQGGYPRVAFQLPPAMLLLSEPLHINITAVFQGAGADPDGSPLSTLSCSTPDRSLIVFGGPALTVVGVALSGCSAPGLILVKGSSAAVTIIDSSFTNFTRTLGPDRANASNPSGVAPITEATAALAVHAPQFSGSLAITRTTFTRNTFSVHASTHSRRSALQVRAAWGASFTGGLTHDGHDPWVLGGDVGEGPGATCSEAGSSASPRRQLQQAGSSSTSAGPSDSLLSRARSLHPGLQDGPWADDMEAVIAVSCSSSSSGGGTSNTSGTGSNSSCSVTLDQVTMTDNTGVATSAVYFMCDGMAHCSFRVLNSTLHENKLLWQRATDEDFLLPTSSPLALTVERESDYSNAAEADVVDGNTIFARMAPWITYTYPLVVHFKEVPALFGQLSSSFLLDPARYPNVTGRTLGAIVVHSRNPPAAGIPSTAEPMVSVEVVGGSYANNDGSIIMSTAADWQDLGNSTGGLARHSADFTFTGVRVEDHASGWPAVWLRWPRKATITDCMVMRSTGAVWLDEVRDNATIDSCAFPDNKLNQRWLDYWNFAEDAPNLNFYTGNNLGVGLAHTVKIQMSPDPARPNSATVRNCSFTRNPSFLTGALYVRASDRDVPFTATNNLPGQTAVTIQGTNFTFNMCRDQLEVPGSTCMTGERPLYIRDAQAARIAGCRFEENTNGGAKIKAGGGLEVLDSVFNGNAVLYDGGVASNDLSRGGGGIHAYQIGNGGVVMRGCTFEDNSVLWGGGAAHLLAFSSTSIVNCTFTNNTALAFSGGAVLLEQASPYVSGGRAPSIFGSTFSGNTAGYAGGALAIRSGALPGILKINGCLFLGNTALSKPVAGSMTLDGLGGGGAIFHERGPSVDIADTSIVGNMAFGSPGGAIRVIDSQDLKMTSVVVQDNTAMTGGGIALERMAAASMWERCTFTNNSAVNKAAWPQYPAQEQLQGVPGSFLNSDAGCGGAFYARGAIVQLLGRSVARGNTALYGGVGALVTARLAVLTLEQVVSASSPSFVEMPDVPALDGPGLDPSPGQALPYTHLFADNSAAIGGALFLSSATDCTLQLVRNPANPSNWTGLLTFLNNTAERGGAIYMEAAAVANIIGARFILNEAKGSGAQPDYDDLRWLSAFSTTMLPFGSACPAGGGGAICFGGRAGARLRVMDSSFHYNRATEGGGVYVSRGANCEAPEPCYQVAFTRVNMTGNKAIGRGGGAFVPQEGLLSVLACSADATLVVPSNATATTAAAANSTPPAPSVTLRLPGRHAPAWWYSQLSASRRAALLKRVGGPVQTTAAAAYTVNGTLFFAEGTVFAVQAGLNTTRVSPSGSTVAADGTVLTSSGGLVLSAASSAAGLLASVGGLPLVLHNSIINDTAWYGVPYNLLPCADWNNTATAGDNIGTSPYFLLSPPLVDFYTSNRDIDIAVTVHDWYGNNCTGNGTHQQSVTVRASSDLVTGQSFQTAVDGVAHFTSLRLRSPEGLQRVTFEGQALDPPQELIPDEVEIYVRSCSINEFLSARIMGECVACSSGSYNFNVSAGTCEECPETAECGNPDPEACQMEECDPEGFLVPQDGYWHSNFFSDQVLECPNPDSCSAEDRSADLSALQVRVWQVARDLQVNNSAAIIGAAELADATPASQLLRRLLQQSIDKALATQLYYDALVNASSSLLPEYLSAQCAAGYEGPLCGVCKSGYGWSNVATCVKCPSPALNSLFYALVTLATAAMLIFTIKTSLKEQPRHGRLIAGIPSKHKDTPFDMPIAHAPVAPLSGEVLPVPPAAQPTVESSKVPDAPADALCMDLDTAEAEPASAVQEASPPTLSRLLSSQGLSIPPPPLNLYMAVSNVPNMPPTMYVCKDPTTAAPGALHDNLQETWATDMFTHDRTPSMASLASVAAGAEEVAEEEDQVEPCKAAPGAPVPSPFTEPSLETMSLSSSDAQGSLVGAGLAFEARITPTLGVAAVGEPRSQPASAGVPEGAQGGSAEVGKYESSDSLRRAEEAQQQEQQQEQQAEKKKEEKFDPNWDELYGNRPRARQTTVVKMLVSFLQVLALIGVMPLNIPRVMDVYYRVNSQVTSFPGNLVSLDCSLPDLPGVSAAIVRVILAVLSPLYICLGSVLFMLLYDVLDYKIFMPFRVHKRKKQRLPPFWTHLMNRWGRQCIVITIIVLFFFYPSSVQAVFSIFSCQDIDSPDGANPLAQAMGLQTQRVWSQDFRQECYKGAHLALALGLGVPVLVLFAAGWPILSALFVSKSMGQLEFWPTLRFTEDMTEMCMKDFKQRYVWWESVVMMRKLAIAAIVTFASAHTSAGVQLLVVMCVLALAVAAQAICMPYHHLYTNILEQAAIIVIIFNIYLSLYFESGITETGQIVLSVIVLAVNISMVVVFIYYIIEAYWCSVLFDTGLGAMESDQRQNISAAEVRQLILKRMLKRKRKNKGGGDSSDEEDPNTGGRGFQWTDSGRSSYQHHIATVYATAVVAGLRIGQTTDRVLHKVRSMRSTGSSELSTEVDLEHGSPVSKQERKRTTSGTPPKPLPMSADSSYRGLSGQVSRSPSLERSAALPLSTGSFRSGMTNSTERARISASYAAEQAAP